MDELAAKYVLLDFELVALLALFLGLAFYLTLSPRRRNSAPLLSHGGTQFDLLDLVLMFFPSLMFLYQPFRSVLMATQGNGGEAPAAASDSLTPLVFGLGYFAFVWVMTYGIIVWIRQRDITTMFGLRRLSPARIVLYSILGTIVGVVVCARWLGKASEIHLDRIFTELSAQEQVQALQNTNSVPYLVLSFLVACIVAPLVEEFLFRGYMYGTVRRFTGPIFASVVIGALFAVMHNNLPALLPLWGLSILLSASYELSKSLWVPIGIHALFNATNIALMLLGSSAVE